MPDLFHSWEESLKEYLSEEQSDRYNSVNANFYKYNNLKFFMDPKRNTRPHFIIRIGISEAVYDMGTGEKLSGGLGVDERLIKRWLERNLHRMDLGIIWKQENKAVPVNMKEDIDD